MRPLMMEEQSERSRPSSVRKTSQSTRDRLQHSLPRLKPEFRANQRLHVSQSPSSTRDQFKTLTNDSPLDPSESLARIQKRLEPSSLFIGINLDEMLEKSLGEVEELLPGLPETEQIVLLRTLANRLDELLYPPNRDACRIHIWGKRLEDLCRFLPLSPSVHSPHRALITRAQAMMGNLSTSRAYVNSIDKTEWDVHAGGTVILAVAFYRGLFQCLEFILRDTPYGHSHIENIIHILLSRTPNVLTVIPRAVEENWSFVQKRNLSCYLLSSTHDPKRLTDIITELQANNIPVTQNKILKTIHSLVATTKDVINAQKLYGSIPPSDDYRYIHAGIHLAGRTGNFKQAQAFFDKLKARGQVNKKHISDVLLSYAVGGHVREVFRLFDECFPKNDAGQRLNRPDNHHYSIALLAHTRANARNARDGDFDAVITLVEDMQRSGLQPDNVTFGSAIRACSFKTKDLQGLSDVFSMMRKLGAKPDRATYTTLLGDFANRKDSESAEFLYKLACEEGIIPDARMTLKLIDALVISGSLEGATRIFDYLSSQPRTSRYLPLEVYNLLIKAHVMMGAPFPGCSSSSKG